MSTNNNSGNNSNNGGSSIIYPNGGYYTVTVPTNVTYFPQQITISGIDLAVPCEEKKEKCDGCICKKCKEYFQFAEPNQEDGTLICWSCRHGW